MTNLQHWFHYLCDLESPDSYIEWSYYAMVAAALERRVWLGQDENAIFPNIYLLLVGPPATGKTRSMSFAESTLRLLQHYNPNLKKLVSRLHFGADMTTKEAIVRQLTFAASDVPHGDSTYTHSSMIFLVEELSTLIKSNDADMVGVFCKLYDARNFLYITKGQGTDDIKNVCLSMLMCTTPDHIRECFSNKVFTQGFASRCVVVYEEEPRFRRIHQGFTDAQRQARTNVENHLRKLSALCGSATYSPEAAAFERELHENNRLETTRVNDDPKLDHYYSRKLIHWRKLSMLMHFGEVPELGIPISLETCQRALRLLTVTESHMHTAFAGITNNAARTFIDRIQHVLRTEGESTVKKLRIKTVDLGRKELFEEALDHLVKTDQAIMTAAGTYRLMQPGVSRTDRALRELLGPSSSNGSSHASDALQSSPREYAAHV